MAFGFFKKKASFADVIYMNGHIYTQDPGLPWASAVACKDGKVMAVGDFEAMDEITGDDTEVVDLNERYMFPGFIDTHGTPVLEALKDQYLQIDAEWDIEPVLDLLSDYVDECDGEVIFGYGFDERILDRFADADEAHAVLDEIESQRPVMLLGISGVHCWVNTLAADMIAEAADEDAVNYITPSYILSILNPLDFDAAEKAVEDYTDNLADKGITAVLNLCAPDYLTNLYLDSLLAAIGEGEHDIKQRFHNAIYINRPFNPQLILHRLTTAKTNCVELNQLITADFMHLEVAESEGEANFSQEALNTICLDVCEKGFNIHLDARDEASYDKACAAFDMLRQKGYKNTTLVLASKYPAPEELDAPFAATWPTDYLNESVFSHVASVHEAIDALTIDAAERLGKLKDFGSIEAGKYADFTVFETNPLDRDLRYFSSMHADMTIIEGLIAYDVEEENTKEMCDILFSMQL